MVFQLISAVQHLGVIMLEDIIDFRLFFAKRLQSVFTSNKPASILQHYLLTLAPSVRSFSDKNAGMYQIFSVVRLHTVLFCNTSGHWIWMSNKNIPPNLTKTVDSVNKGKWKKIQPFTLQGAVIKQGRHCSYVSSPSPKQSLQGDLESCLLVPCWFVSSSKREN